VGLVRPINLAPALLVCPAPQFMAATNNTVLQRSFCYPKEAADWSNSTAIEVSQFTGPQQAMARIHTHEQSLGVNMHACHEV
jgi:hypothetical protein